VVGSLLLGLYGEDGKLHHVGVSASFSLERRAELLDEIAPYRVDTMEGHPWEWRDVPEDAQRLPGGLSRWSGKKNLEWLPLRPELVIEVGYDAMEGNRFRHTAQFKRWRPDRIPESCTYAQLERPLRIDVDAILAGTA
jgi:ATP-dependent DNA ligase